MLEVFLEVGVPLHLAVVPGQCQQKTAKYLVDLAEQRGGLIEFGQHGWLHTNHDLSGGYAEFGKMRSLSEQLADMSRGKRVMTELFGASSSEIFTPPFNSYDQNTVACAEALGFRGFGTWSGRVLTCPRSQFHLRPVELNCDFMAEYLPSPEAREAGSLCREICDRLAQDGYLGLMLHHEMLEQRDRKLLAGLLESLAGSPFVEFCPLSEY
jgi:hypothetical protein